MHETMPDVRPLEQRIPQAVLTKFREFDAMVVARSLITWAEHCSECAFPLCYSSCSFYTPRHDLHCRRFRDGIVPIANDGLHFMGIEFRKWGKLEGVGPTSLVSIQAARRRERLDSLVTEVIRRFSPTHQLSKKVARRWDKLKSKAGLPYSGAGSDGFVIEAYYAASEPTLAFTLSIIPTGENRTGFFQTRFELVQGYNRIFTPRATIEAHLNLSEPYLIQLEPLGDAIHRLVIFGMLDFVYIPVDTADVQAPPAQFETLENRAPAKEFKTAKCVAWDLDNTLWCGTLAEDGPEGLTVNPIAREAVLELDRRGILQSVVSKNDPEPALAALEEFGLREYFLFPQVSWGPKSQSLKRLAELLDIGIDTFVFIDDQPFERGEVKEALPMVSVLAERDLHTLLANSLFDVPVTDESAKRRSMYRTEEQRQSALAGSAVDYTSFLRSCDIKLEIIALSEEHIDRAYELSQRTNQLNVSGQRYLREDLKAMLTEDAQLKAWMLRCEDRFGNYGMIGLCIIRRDEALVESFMMSCRVQRKRVEHAFFSWLCHQKSPMLKVQYRRTERNRASFEMLLELGFEYQEQRPDSGVFVRTTNTPFSDDDIVHVITAK
jgi:FkbH-like protein